MFHRISVIVPAYNAGKTIGQTLLALTNQSYPAELYEIIVVDDGSTDGTGDIIKDCAVNLHTKKFAMGVKYIRQENRGPAAARNRGVEDAKGEIILFTDSDCVPDVNWISEMVKPFTDMNVVGVKGAYRTRQQSIIARFAQIEFEERFEILKKAESIDMVDTYSAGFRKDIFLKMGGFDTSFPSANNEDTELSYRMSRLGFKMVFNPTAIVYHLNHPDSVVRYARLKFWRGYWRIVVYKRYPDKMLKDTYTPQSLKFQSLFLLLLLAYIPFAAVIPVYGVYLFLLIALCFILLSIPFAALAFKKEPFLWILSPLFLAIRASSIGLGALWGVLRPA